jgi:signal transduction histidine kinase
MSTTAQRQSGQPPGYYEERTEPDEGPASQAAARLAQLQDLTAALLEAKDAAEVAAAVVACACGTLGARTCAVRLLNSVDSTLDELRSAGLSPAIQERFRRLPITAENPLAAAARAGAPLFFPSLAELVESYPQFAATLAAQGLETFAAMPLLARGRTLGTLGVAFAEARPFDKASRGMLVALAGQCALALDRAQLVAEASAAARARDRFIAVAAHDLRTPLTVLLGQAQMLERRLEGEGANEPLTRAAQMIVQQSARMSRMISALLDLSRLEERQLTLAREPVELRQVIERVIDEQQAATRRHRFTLTADSGPHLVLGDPARLEQIFHNLLGNAVRYSPAGGPVTVALTRRGGEVCVEVSDWGIGVPAQALPRLFDRFYRGPNVDDGRTSGQGLGLYVVRELVTLHGGAVSASSVQNEGSTFTVCLPALAEPG